MKDMQLWSSLKLLAFLFMIFVIGACSNTGVEPTDGEESLVNEDVAESIATTLSRENGGVLDHVGDVAEIAGGTDVPQLSKGSDEIALHGYEATYDSVAGLWTAVISRERSNPPGTRYASYERVYTWQYLNAGGSPQKHYVTDEDTAVTINFNIVEGSGKHQTPRLTQELKELEAAFVATNTNTDTIVINGTYHRAAADTISTRNMTRTHDYTLDLVLNDVTVPRHLGAHWMDSVSGTITGTYQGEATFTRGNGYKEKSIERDIDIDLADGEARIRIRGVKFIARLISGDMTGR